MKRFVLFVDFLLILVFLGLMIVPIVTADFQGGKLSVAENRMLATFPDFASMEITAIPRAFENWINDNIGGRSIASEIDTKVQWNLFKTSAKTDTRIGQDEWLFYYRPDIGADYRHDNLLTQEQLAQFAKDSQIVMNYITGKGAHPLMLMLPDKKTIYPELFPKGLEVKAQPSRADQIYQYVVEQNAQGNTSLPMMWLCGELMNIRNTRLIYSPRLDNAHWNIVGAYVGYEQLCKALQPYFPNLSYIPLDNCQVTPYEKTDLFNGALEISETDFIITTGNEGTYRDDSAALDSLPLGYAGDPYDWKVRTVNQNSSLPRLLYVGDSYTLKMFPFLSQSFSEMTFLHTDDMQYLPEMMDRFQPDIVVVEWVERQWSLASSKMWETATKLYYLQNPAQ